MIHVSTQYFSYRTTTKVESQLQDVIRYPSLILCSRIIDFLNETELAEFKTSSAPINDLTVSQLNKLTPTANESIENCYLRIDDYRLFKMYDKDTCYRYFTVKKLIVGENVCYQFYPLNTLSYSINNVANAFNYTYTVYELTLISPFMNIKDLYILAHYPSITEVESGEVRLPVYSRKFGKIVFNYRETDNWLLSRPNEEVFDLLPPPYDTSCRSGYQYCRRDCMLNTSLSMLSRFPFSEPIGDNSWDNNLSSDYKILNTKDLEDPKKMLTWKQIVHNCKEGCSRKPCEIAMTSNFAYLFTFSDESTETYDIPISLTASVATAYPRKITSLPEINWIKYTSGICNSLSIWFGFSVLATNPLTNIFRRTKLCHPDNYLIKSALVCYYVACLLGFVYQSAEVCKEYFLYKTAMTIEVSNLDDYPYQSLGFCFESKSLLNKSAVDFIIPNNNATETEYSNEDTRLLTLKQIFDFTPNPEDLITDCGMKNKSNYGVDRMAFPQCLQNFTVIKAVRGIGVCYFIVPRKHMTYSWTKVASSLHDSRQVYYFITNIQVNKPTVALLISYDALPDIEAIQYKLPLESQNFAHAVMILPQNFITISSHTTGFIRLPEPYDTRCRPNFFYQICLGGCLDKELESLNRKTYLNLYDMSHNVSIFKDEDFLNETVASFALDAFRSCNVKCTGNSCQQSVSFTSPTIHLKTEYKYLIFASVLPASPNINILYIPSTDPLNFFIYLCNCFGIWFGLSMLSLNPVVIWRKGHKFLLHNLYQKSTYDKKLFHLFLLACFAGFLWQSYLVLSGYFVYTTVSRIEVTADDVYPFPAINLCVRYRDFVNHSEYSKLTVQDIYNLTPEENITLSGCKLRNEITLAVTQFSREKCLGHIKTEKYISGSNVCYVYQPAATYSLSEITSTATNTGVIYELLLSPNFNIVTDLSFYWITLGIGHKSSARAGRSRKYIAQIFRDAATNESLNYFILQGKNTNITLLPDPYDTNCIADASPEICFSKCYTEFVKSRLNRVPFDEQITEPVNLRMVSKEDLTNNSFAQQLNVGHYDCLRQCSRHDCNDYYSTTDLSGYWKPLSEHEGLVLAVGPPSTSGLIVKTYPSLILIDFLNNVAVSGSIWLGVSVLSIAMFPIKLWKSRQGRGREEKSRLQRLNVCRKRVIIKPRIYCPCLYCQQHFKGRVVCASEVDVTRQKHIK